MKKLMWAFMIGVAVLDVWFTWSCRSTVSDWESNPIAALAFQYLGVTGAALYRGFWLLYAALMSWTQTRYSWMITPVWALGHAYLLVTLLQSMQYMAYLAG